MSKTDNASDAGDDASSIKSGSTITNSGNINQQSQDSTSISTSIVSSSSPWSANPTIPGMDAGPWANSSSPAPTSLNSMGWNSTTPTSLSLNNQGHNSNMPPGGSAIGSNTFPSSASGGWPSGISGNTMASTMPPNVTSLPSGNISSQWPASTMLGKMGDFPKTSEATWNTPTSMLENKDLGVSSDPRQWGLDKLADQNWESAKSQWGNTPAAGSVDQGASNGADLSFAQATLKGLKMPPGGSLPPTALTSRQEEILRAIENHDGWGSRPIRQDTSWEHDDNHKSNKRFQAENNSGASNVWNNSDGTAIWEAVRENQGGSNWGGASGNASGQNNWNAEKDQQNWGGPPKPQDPNNWGVGGAGGNADPKSFGSWDGAGGAGDASSKMWGQQQKNAIGSWGDAPNVQRSTSISSWGEDGESNNWDSQRQITGGMNRMQNMVPPSPGMNPPSGVPGMMPQGVPGMNMPGMGADPTPWNTTNPGTMNPPKMDEPWNKPPPKITSGWGDPAQDAKVDDGTAIWGGSSMQKQVCTLLSNTHLKKMEYP